MRALKPLHPKAGHDRLSVATEAPANPEAPDDNHYIDFTLPSLDAHAAAFVEHPAWPWVCWDGVSSEVVEVDYFGLSLG